MIHILCIVSFGIQYNNETLIDYTTLMNETLRYADFEKMPLVPSLYSGQHNEEYPCYLTKDIVSNNN